MDCEGDRPGVIQQFIRPGGQEMAQIIIKALPVTPGTTASEDELKQFFSPSNFKGMLPRSATFIDGKATKIEGLPGAMLQYSMREERAGMTIDVSFVSFIFIYQATMVQLQCS